MKGLKKEESKANFTTKLLLLAFFYGLFVVNIIDLTVQGFPGYHLFLTLLYFYPFLVACLVLGFDDWELLIGLGFVSSLMNDLLYAPVGVLLFKKHYDLAEWYLWQLGFRGLDVKWYFDAGFVRVPVSSILMGLSIYARILVSYLVLRKWWREA